MRIPVILVISIISVSPAPGAQWISEGTVTADNGTYSFAGGNDNPARFKTTGMLSPESQPGGPFTLKGDVYLPETTVKSRAALVFIVGETAPQDDTTSLSEIIYVQSDRPPLGLTASFTGDDTFREHYRIKRHPDWLLIGGVDALCAVGAVVMARWGRIWGPAPESWGGGEVNYLLGYGGAAFFTAAGTIVTIWQLLRPSGKVEAMGYPFPTVGVKPDAGVWTPFELRNDGARISFYLNDELAIKQEGNFEGGIQIRSVESNDFALKNLYVEE